MHGGRRRRRRRDSALPGRLGDLRRLGDVHVDVRGLDVRAEHDADLRRLALPRDVHHVADLLRCERDLYKRRVARCDLRGFVGEPHRRGLHRGLGHGNVLAQPGLDEHARAREDGPRPQDIDRVLHIGPDEEGRATCDGVQVALCLHCGEGDVWPLWVEALGRSSDVADPSAFLLDAAGQWVIGYLGAVETERILADAAEVATLATNQPRAPKLLGGRWVLRRDRDWKMLSAIFRELGAAELAELYRSRAAPPNGR